MTKQQTSDDRDVSLLAHDQYVRSVKWTPCVDKEEEERLLERIERGRVEQHKACPDVQVCEDAMAARDRLVAGYQRLIMHFAGKYVHHRRTMDFLDLVQEGNIALLRAIELQRERTCRFSTLVSACVCCAMIDAIHDGDRLVRLPRNVSREVGHMRRAISRLFDALGHEPLVEEIATALGVTKQRILDLKECEQRGNVESVQALVEEHGGAEEGYDFASLFTASVVAETGRQKEVQAMVQQAVETGLAPRCREAITLRYGLNDGWYHGEKEMAAAMGVKVSYIRGELMGRAKKQLRAALAVPCARYYDDIVA